MQRFGWRCKPGTPPTSCALLCRPADAVNLAVRFGAPIYVNKEVREGPWKLLLFVIGSDPAFQLST